MRKKRLEEIDRDKIYERSLLSIFEMIDSELLDGLLSKADEDLSLQFKREINLFSDKEKTEFAKDVTAFANAEGGYLLFGKEDKKEGGKIIGIELSSFDPDQMQQIIAQRCYPPPVFSPQLIERNSKYLVISNFFCS
jgi:predicted HTH transcriptional regulator